jgi:hypothetical protein
MCVRLWVKPGCLVGDNIRRDGWPVGFVGILWIVVPRASHVLATCFAHVVHRMALDIQLVPYFGYLLADNVI